LLAGINCPFALGQQNDIPGLKHRLSDSTLSDTSHINALNKLCEAYLAISVRCLKQPMQTI
jgi:hypothetical protein